MPGGLRTPGVGAQVQSVVSPPKRSTGDCPGVRLRTSWSKTGSGSAAGPKYRGAERYSMDRPTKPGGMGRLSGAAPIWTRMAERGTAG